MEPNVVDYRERLLKAYRKAIIPLKAYMRQYEEYRDIFLLTIEDYVEWVSLLLHSKRYYGCYKIIININRNFREEKHSASETREEVQTHYDAKEALILRLPQYITIGPFSINVDTLKVPL